MMISQLKSTCCGAGVSRHGDRRRRCAECGATWSVRPAKRGRKAIRPSPGRAAKVVSAGLKVVQAAAQSGMSAAVMYKRMGRSLSALGSPSRSARPPRGRLVLLVDAQWRTFGRRRWTLHLFALKPVGSDEATFLDPVLTDGKESATTWRGAIATLPPNVRKRVVALVSDGLRGIEGVADENGWALQRCHFHLIAGLRRACGPTAKGKAAEARDRAAASVRVALGAAPGKALDAAVEDLRALARGKATPPRLRSVVREFLRRLEDFRRHLTRPELGLPTTTNVMESANSYVAKRANAAGTPKSWLKWSTACVRVKPKYNCRDGLWTQN
jgi:hypothetical protein